MSNINFTYEEIAKEVDLKYSTYNPSILLEAIKLVIYGMVNNYESEYHDSILNMLDRVYLVFTDNTRDIYIKNIKNIKDNNSINMVMDEKDDYAIFIDYKLSNLGIIENLVKAFNKIFTYAINDIGLKKVFTSIQCETIIKFILNCNIDNKLLSNIPNMDINRYSCSSNIGENLFKKIYCFDSIKRIIDKAIISNDSNIIKIEVDSILGSGSFERISILYDNISKSNANGNTHAVAMYYLSLREFINKYLSKKIGII